MEFYKSEGLSRPVEIDFKSSPTTVFIRKNIEEIQKTDEETGETFTAYQYDEARVSKADYIAMLKERQDETDAAMLELILITFGGENDG